MEVNIIYQHFPLLDNMLSELQRQFSKLNWEIIMGIQSLNPVGATFWLEGTLFFICINVGT